MLKQLATYATLGVMAAMPMAVTAQTFTFDLNDTTTRSRLGLGNTTGVVSEAVEGDAFLGRDTGAASVGAPIDLLPSGGNTFAFTTGGGTAGNSGPLVFLDGDGNDLFVTATNPGGLFFLDSVDLTAASADPTTSASIFGSVGGATPVLLATTTSTGSNQVTGAPIAVDTLFFNTSVASASNRFDNIVVTAVPEPGSLALLGLGGAALLIRRRHVS